MHASRFHVGVARLLRESMARLRHAPILLHRDRVRGFVYDVDTGVLSEVGPGPAVA